MQIRTPLVLAMMLSGAIVSSTAIAQGAVSGELRDVKGSVMVLKGKDYVNGAPGMALAAGDRILVLEKAIAKVVVVTAGQRCEIDLKENQALTVTAIDCKALTAAVQTVPGAGAPGSAAVAAAGAGGGSAAAAAAGSGVAWIGGAAVVGGAVFAGTRNTSKTSVDTRLKASGD